MGNERLPSQIRAWAARESVNGGSRCDGSDLLDSSAAAKAPKKANAAHGISGYQSPPVPRVDGIPSGISHRVVTDWPLITGPRAIIASAMARFENLNLRKGKSKTLITARQCRIPK